MLPTLLLWCLPIRLQLESLCVCVRYDSCNQGCHTLKMWLTHTHHSSSFLTPNPYTNHKRIISGGRSLLTTGYLGLSCPTPDPYHGGLSIAAVLAFQLAILDQLTFRPLHENSKDFRGVDDLCSKHGHRSGICIPGIAESYPRKPHAFDQKNNMYGFIKFGMFMLLYGYYLLNVYQLNLLV